MLRERECERMVKSVGKKGGWPFVEGNSNETKRKRKLYVVREKLLLRGKERKSVTRDYDQRVREERGMKWEKTEDVLKTMLIPETIH